MRSGGERAQAGTPWQEYDSSVQYHQIQMYFVWIFAHGGKYPHDDQLDDL